MLQAFEKLSEDRKGAILDAAAKVFAEQGYHAARISQICEEALISNGALYKYFRNKEDLFLAVTERCIEIMVKELYLKHTVSNISIYEAIHRFLEGFVYLAENYKDYMSIYADLTCSPNQGVAIQAAEKIEKTASKFMIQMIQDGKRRKEINNQLEDNLVAFFIDNYYTMFLYSLVSPYHHTRFEAFAPGKGELTVDDKIDLIMQSVKIVLNEG